MQGVSHPYLKNRRKGRLHYLEAAAAKKKRYTATASTTDRVRRISSVLWYTFLPFAWHRFSHNILFLFILLFPGETCRVDLLYY